MKRRRWQMAPLLTLVLLLAGVLAPYSLSFAQGNIAAAPPLPGKVLLLYDSLGTGTSKEGNIAALERLLASFGAEVTAIRLDDYEAGNLTGYKLVVEVQNLADQEAEQTEGSKVFSSDLASYSGKFLQIGGAPPGFVRAKLGLSVSQVFHTTVTLTDEDGLTSEFQVNEMDVVTGSRGASMGHFSVAGQAGSFPFAVKNGDFVYTPYFEQGNGSVFELAKALKQWIYLTGDGQVYLVLKEIYPFSDLNLLMQMADRLYDLGIPFIASVQPVFNHTDYPAMLRYLDALRYVQSRGGSVLVNAPVVMDGVEVQEDNLAGRMQDFIDVLLKSGVVPLGIGAELYWSHDGEYTPKGTAFFDSAVLFPDQKPVYKEPLNVYRSFKSAPYSLSLDLIGQSFEDHPLSGLPMDTAATLDFPETEDDMQKLLSDLKSSWISFADYKQSSHHTTTQTYQAVSDHGELAVNGRELDVGYGSKPVDDRYQYVQKSKQSFEQWFRVQNTFFMIVIVASLLVFGGLLLFGFRLYRRKFIKFRQGE